MGRGMGLMLMAESIAHFYDQFISRSMEGDKQTRSVAGVRIGAARPLPIVSLGVYAFVKCRAHRIIAM
jgi:hypothetical protein